MLDTVYILFYINNLENLSFFQILYYIFSLVMTQLIATKITKRLGIEESNARFAWLPIYGTFVLSKLTLKSYKYATWQLLAIITLFITASVFYISLALFFIGADLFTNTLLFYIIVILSLITLLLNLVFTYKINRGVARVFNYGVFATLLSLYFAPIVWLIFIFSEQDNKYI